ncbi:MAG: hypothetical protein WGN25_04000 [Candidatus Electrothrix sp. GW3-4]|uniref:hypothetical protein n=1 Tax=Candidatus Electrothrix sp. GW3-4 TaxID=3126740 RepID=UPI0030CEA339
MKKNVTRVMVCFVFAFFLSNHLAAAQNKEKQSDKVEKTVSFKSSFIDKCTTYVSASGDPSCSGDRLCIIRNNETGEAASACCSLTGEACNFTCDSSPSASCGGISDFSSDYPLIVRKTL